MTIENAIWFTQYAHCIGIVKVVTPHGVRYYIGVGEGRNEDEDKRFIAERGARFPDKAGAVLLG